MTRFEPTMGIAEFAQMIRESGLPVSNAKLLAMFQAGVFAGYSIYIFKMDQIEGFISKASAQRWIEDHSVEAMPTADMIAFAKTMETATA